MSRDEERNGLGFTEKGFKVKRKASAQHAVGSGFVPTLCATLIPKQNGPVGVQNVVEGGMLGGVE